MARRSGRWVSVWAVLAGREGPRGVWPAVIQIVLVVMWHPAISEFAEHVNVLTSNRVAEFWGRFGFTPTHTSEELVLYVPKEARDVLIPLGLIAFEGCFAYLIFILTLRKKGRTRVSFFRYWWRACLWNSPLALAGAAFVGVLPPLAHAVGLTISLLAAVWLVVFPTVIARSESWPRRLPRWRPECPECGYSVRRATGDRCPECGEAYPTNSRVYRRWAVRKLPWERRFRASLLATYTRSVLGILLCPCRAGWRMSDPRSMGRPVRWAVVHVILLAAPLSGIWSPPDAMEAAINSTFKPPNKLALYPPELMEPAPTVRELAIWSVQTWLAWCAVLFAMPAIAIAASCLLNAGPPAARRVCIKWSLYATVALAPAILAWHALVFSRYYSGGWNGWLAASARMCAPPTALLACVYGLYWAAGAANQPWCARRGVARFVRLTLLFAVAWFTAAELLFPPGALSNLL